jgi:hypothetical protein
VKSSYPAARLIAPRLRAHFEAHLSDARARGESHLAEPPEIDAIEAIIDAAFWASLRREEGYVPKISLALVPPDERDHPLLFERPLPLAPTALTRLAPAVERPGIHLGVWRQGQAAQELAVWGTTRVVPPMTFVLEVVAPGLLVVKHRRSTETAKFVNVAVLEGDQIKVLDGDGHGPAVPDRQAILKSLIGFEAASKTLNVLVELAVSMRVHGRGGALLIVPGASVTWRESIAQPISYSIRPPYLALADLVRQIPEKNGREWQDALRRTVDGIAGLTAVDGATVLTDQYELLAFGAKIIRRHGTARVEQVIMSEPVEGNTPTIVGPSELGGTRHMSAAQFVHDQRDAAAYVASQDGHFTVFAWSACDSLVHARRVESLLL